MITLEDIRRCALRFPEAEEFTRFRQPGREGGTTVVFSVTQEEAAAAAAHDPAIYAEGFGARGPR